MPSRLLVRGNLFFSLLKAVSENAETSRGFCDLSGISDGGWFVEATADEHAGKIAVSGTEATLCRTYRLPRVGYLGFSINRLDEDLCLRPLRDGPRDREMLYLSTLKVVLLPHRSARIACIEGFALGFAFSTGAARWGRCLALLYSSPPASLLSRSAWPNGRRNGRLPSSSSQDSPKR